MGQRRQSDPRANFLPEPAAGQTIAMAEQEIANPSLSENLERKTPLGHLLLYLAQFLPFEGQMYAKNHQRSSGGMLSYAHGLKEGKLD